MINYQTIKATAKEYGHKVSDYLALSQSADPFYCGSPGQMEKAEWFAEVYRKMGSPENVHVRRAHYWLVSQDPKYLKPDGTVYLNNDQCWKFVSLASKYARYAGLVPMGSFIDRRNPEPIKNVSNWEDEVPTEVKEETNAEEIIELIAEKFYCWNSSNTQPYMMEIWCEKSTMNDVLEPICQRYGMNLVTGLGELSITAVHQLVQRIYRTNKPTRIFYISDFDPAGEGMPISVSRKIEYMIQGKGYDVKLIPMMLTPEQCIEYDLPRTPIKAGNTRKDDFENRHGAGATELDALEALHPGEMESIITSEIENYFDREKWNKAVQTNWDLRDKVREHLKPLMTNMLDEMDLTEFDEIEIGVGDLIDDSNKDWLFDSGLKYSDQLSKYKNYKS